MKNKLVLDNHFDKVADPFITFDEEDYKEEMAVKMAFDEAMQRNAQISKELNIPLAKYDHDKKQVYLLYSDGSREYVD